MENNFYEVLKNRRSIYGISKEAVVSDERIKEIIEFAVTYVPSSFNAQSTRVILLLGGEHDKVWDITKENLRKIVPAEQFGSTEEKINSFKNGYGTVLFFEDNSVVESLQKQFELYKDNFPVWANQSNAMNQLVVWAGLEAEGLGASLQHYTEIIEEDVKSTWNVPSNWKLIAQMPFGKPVAAAGEKQFQPIEERVKIFK